MLEVAVTVAIKLHPSVKAGEERQQKVGTGAVVARGRTVSAASFTSCLICVSRSLIPSLSELRHTTWPFALRPSCLRPSPVGELIRVRSYLRPGLKGPARQRLQISVWPR